MYGRQQEVYSLLGFIKYLEKLLQIILDCQFWG